MANPERACGYEDDEDNPTGLVIFLLLVVVAPLVYLGGVFFGFWGISPNSSPTYDSSGEIVNEDEYYEEKAQEAYEEYQAEQAAEATWVKEDFEQMRREENMESSCAACWDKFYCNRMSSCDEAYHCLNNCGMTRLDGDSNGIPCENLCGTP